eukprot:XP_013963752.1 uncharacterized protein LOC106557868 [Canis lupus familiaris]
MPLCWGNAPTRDSSRPGPALRAEAAPPGPPRGDRGRPPAGLLPAPRPAPLAQPGEWPGGGGPARGARGPRAAPRRAPGHLAFVCRARRREICGDFGGRADGAEVANRDTMRARTAPGAPRGRAAGTPRPGAHRPPRAPSARAPAQSQGCGASQPGRRQAGSASASGKSNTGSTPRASPRPAPASLPSRPRGWAQPGSLGASGAVQSRLGSAAVTCSSAPHGHRCRAAAGGGKPRPPQPPLPALLPSLPPSFSPSLPLSLPRAAARGALPRATCSGPNPGISERERHTETRSSGAEKQGRKTPTRAHFAGSDRGPAPRGRRRGEGCGACCLPAPRALHAGAAAPGRAHAKRTPRPLLAAAHPVARLAARLAPERALLRRGPSPHAILPVRAPAGRHPRAPRAPLPGPRTHKAGAPPQPPGPSRRCPSPVPGKGCVSEPRQGRGPGRREPGSRRGGRGGSPGRPEPPPPASRLGARGSPWRALACLVLRLPQVLNTHTPGVQLYKSCSSFPYHN